ncbi:alkyl hydroperoxide reductase/ Thiol specific antioxidant/ Mal allergen [Sulfolobus islandicus Y.G.57.14]|jgi:peroxiredoxin Q/BCP|uniref:thioredoxin-dependent peroxiredoxin n=4 Tax=Saccharolobus islandicus TaxID=43080 RepID=C3MJE4_SACI2|nr:peroxiredoxin [Sulfolobus islandicus]ACP34222.1 alkyl hydroperoxide reductase/ Thiol specific antioxidant/ Mal allergen [Sulfolobus islandicus L.S.2.15]ACP44362.1 alkyl hydroperoxide reductase/ Thiol specific antioxidant/ Mal allergen [Sulfolobus islandicus Y.G.57.14]ACP47266.1 alkyl hydroperoxide reductase/ Thiol specific antioxidant/ Mal allergen [Sulfolobus islandicus Y.N.15.51]ADB85872.1 alkyl hydroperoxide reductase/ Thiol specific antioxidant/ Mal allergen [Sulfolobus islandicus L.D.8.
MNVGEEAPDFEAESTLGKIKLSDFRGKKVILYFYPKSFTSGCTRELQRFTELYDEFKKLNAEVIGVSVDKIDTQKKFAEKYGAKFPIVADAQKTISKLYSVLNERGTSAQRVTFIIDENGKIVDILKNLKKAEEHADKSLEIIKEQNST